MEEVEQLNSIINKSNGDISQKYQNLERIQQQNNKKDGIFNVEQERLNDIIKQKIRELEEAKSQALKLEALAK